MAAPVQTGMEKAEMRKLLLHTKEKPVHCAIGVGRDQAFGLLIMDRLKQPKMLEKQLIDSMPEAKNTRWGTAQVDWDDDPKLVKLYLNKPVSSMARRLVKTLKGTGFSKVQIMMEDGTPVEGAADEEEAAAAAPDGAAPPADAAANEAGAAPPAPPPPPQAEAPAHDAADLARRLAALAPRIPQVAGDDAARKAELLKLATQANVNIKTNNLTYAATYIGQLERALGGAGGNGAAAPPPVPPPAAAAPPPAPPPAAAAPAQDAAALGKLLATLIPRVGQVSDAGRKAELAKLATQANVNLKTNNLTYAATYIEQLRRGLDGGAAQPAAEPGPPAAPSAAPPNADALRNLLGRLTLRIPEAAENDEALRRQWVAMSDEASGLLDGGDLAAAAPAVERLRAAMAAALQRMQDAAKLAGTYDKSGQAWLATRQRVEAELGKLRGSILDAYKGQPFVSEIEAKFSERTGPVLHVLDLRLSEKLTEVSKATDKARRSQLIDQAHDLIDDYRAYAANPLLADLDDNPFVPLSMQATVTRVLDTLAKELR